MSSIRYISTNRDLANGFREEATFAEALAMGQAPDGGLFMPTRLPFIEPAELLSYKGRSYADLAARLARCWLGEELGTASVEGLVREAYDFPVPLERADETTWVMRLDQGPTASFKDFAARLLARLVRLTTPAGKRLTVLVATSGDTGSAVGEAFKGLENVRVFILYPEREVSPSQKLQLDTIGDNVRALALDGKFDDCQALVKRAFADPGLAALGLTSANSINVGRVLPQTFYFAYAWAQLSEGEPFVFSVPSGNFGDALGCELMRRAGLPVGKLILAVNGNDEFPRFLETGRYEKVSPSRNCLSNAMNVGHPSNLARFFDLYGGTVDKDGAVHRVPDLEAMRRALVSFSVSDEETRAAIRRVHEKKRLLLEPHGAVGWAGLERYRAATGDGRPAIVLETAHPAKFPEAIRETIGVEPEAPATLRGLDDRPASVDRLPASYEALKNFLLSS